MQIKFITAVSFLALAAATQANAADLIKHHSHTASAAMAKPVAVKPDFSWTGLYAGAQGSSDWGKHKFNLSATRKMGAKFTEKLDQFGAGLFAGFNRALPNGAVFGIETDMMWKSEEGAHSFKHPDDPTAAVIAAAKAAKRKAPRGMTEGSINEFHNSFKEKWTGATRVRLGFAKDKILPYIAGGIAYSNILTNATLISGPDNGKKTLTIANKSTTMIGWTAGAGVDCALANNLLVRLEYRYSDFGKKSLKYSGENKQSFLYDFKHNTQDVRVGVAYKF
ncbi:outer membrane protein [Bartonella sp. TP]|uniref:outer membrane protein n=1 Tax=Bartonella sp. TP TaxID=3057550 RepID=UPI0025B1DF21|nr:outer membrane protein [Bartonella sp. TP]WJW80365.1 porin family protein [Bartonella sp. TP]